MAKILVLYYSAYGHIETMAKVEHLQQKVKGSLKLVRAHAS